MKLVTRFPLLTKMIYVQAGIIVCGLLFLFCVYVLTQRTQRDLTISRLRAQILPAISSRQEQWRAWKFLGLDSAIIEETNDLLTQLPLRSLRVIKQSELPQFVSAVDIILPADRTSTDEYVVHAELNADQVDGAAHSSLVLIVVLIGTAFLFLGTILLSGRYIYKRVYRPMLMLNQILSSRSPNEATDFSDVPAIGEMRDFLNTLSLTITRLIDEQERLTHEAAFGGIAKSVAHDIRSPVSALTMLLAMASNLPDDQRNLMRAATIRINQIADGLLQRSKLNPRDQSFEKISLENISSLLHSCIEEKRVEMRDKGHVRIHLLIPPDVNSLRVPINSVLFGRVISNLLNNAIEAQASKICVSLSRTEQHAFLSISDNGKGIPSDILEQLEIKSLSYGKAEGSGLGLQSLKEFAKHGNAEFEIISSVGTGTSIELRLSLLQTGIRSNADEVNSC